MYEMCKICVQICVHFFWLTRIVSVNCAIEKCKINCSWHQFLHIFALLFPPEVPGVGRKHPLMRDTRSISPYATYSLSLRYKVHQRPRVCPHQPLCHQHLVPEAQRLCSTRRDGARASCQWLLPSYQRKFRKRIGEVVFSKDTEMVRFTLLKTQ